MSKIPVFDIGDTITPDTRIINQVTEEVLERRDLGESVEFPTYGYSIFKPPEIQKMLKEKGISDPEPIANEISETYKSRWEEFVVEEGVIELLQECNQLGTIGFITDNPREAGDFYRQVFEDQGLEYECMVVSGEEGVEKPETGIFNAFLGCREEPGERFVYFGNNAEIDAACEKVDMDFAWVTQYKAIGSYRGETVDRLSYENVQEAVST